MKPITRTIMILCLLTFTSCLNGNNPINEPPGVCGVIDNGTKVKQPDIFKAKCATCHSYDKDLTGPRMHGVLDKVSQEWLIQFITNQDSLIDIEDEYTLKIMQWSPLEWNHNFNDLRKQDLEALVDYIKQ